MRGALKYNLLVGSAAPSLARLLFGVGENGFLLGNFAEMDEMFQTQAGLTAVASDSDTVGGALDDHDWGASSYAAILAAATELFPDGGMTDASTGWTYSNATGSIVGGALRLTSTAVGVAARTGYKTLTGLTIGRAYRVAVTVVGVGGTAGASSSVIIQALTTAGAGVQNSETATGAGTRSLVFVATATSHRIQMRFDNSSGDATTYAEFDDVTVKAVSGNHVLQATGTQKPLWRSNGGKPYLQPDGTDDQLTSPFTPGPAVTYAIAVQIPATVASTQLFMGSAITAGSRATIGVSTVGRIIVSWGDLNGTALTLTDYRGQKVVVVATDDGVTRDFYINGTNVRSEASAGSITTGVPIAIGAQRFDASYFNFTSAFIFAAAVRNAKSTPALVSRINSDFTGTMQ